MMEDFFINNTWLLFVINVKNDHINHLLYSYTDNHNGPTVHSIQEDKLNTGTKSTRVSSPFIPFYQINFWETNRLINGLNFKLRILRIAEV